MDAAKINQVLEGHVGIDELSVIDRMAFTKLVVCARVTRAPERLPTRFVVPEPIEAMYRGRSI